MSKLKNILTFIIGWPLSFLALYFICKLFLPHINAIIPNLWNINIWLLITGLICFLCYYMLRSLLWHKILRLLGYNFRYKQNAYFWAQSEFKRYIPGNIWSFVGKSLLFTNLGVTKKHLAKAILVELQLIFLGAVIVSLFSIPYLIRYYFNYLSKISYLSLVLFIFTAIVIIIYSSQTYWVKYFRGKLQNFILGILPVFTMVDNFTLLLYAALAVFFFGLGYFFSISAIVALDPRLIIALTGFFVLSLLIGLLSFITPTGLGVREGVITFGLAKILDMSLAGFASIFGRIILVISEIIFIFTAYLYYSLKSVTLNKLEKFFANHVYEILLAILIAIFVIYFSTVSFLRYDNFYAGRFDLGNMDQTVWNTIHGRIFQLTDPDGTTIISRLAVHADFILILLAPMYLIWEDPRMLLLLQVFVVAIGAVFVYLLASNIIKNKLLALSIGFAYLFNPSIQWSILYDFHAVTLATTFLLGAFYFLWQKRLFWFTLFLLFAALTKENVWIITALMGGYLMWSGWKVRINKQIILGIVITLISCLMFYLLIWQIIPLYSISGKHFALTYFSENNDGVFSLIKNSFLSPLKTLTKIFSTDRLVYLNELLLPFGYLPILAPLAIIFSCADIFLNLLSNKVELHQIYYQYTATITPFLLISAIYALKYIINKRKIPIIICSIYIVFSVILSSYYYSPMPWSMRPNIQMFINPQPLKTYMDQKLSQIPISAKVAATNNLGAYLSERTYIYTLPIGIKEADIIVMLLTAGSAPDELTTVKKLQNDKTYSMLWEKGNFIAFRKKSYIIKL
jgi:uncharacterized membrane protein/uncharacterized membrane protein YbhN (UPF0104 family)